ncbi:MAG: hypothetical protein ACTHKL_15755 [Streptosporangiaceae bacterium]
MTAEQLAEGLRIAVDVPLQQLGIAARGAIRSRQSASRGGGFNDRLALRRQGLAGACAARLLRFRRVSRSASCRVCLEGAIS